MLTGNVNHHNPLTNFYSHTEGHTPEDFSEFFLPIRSEKLCVFYLLCFLLSSIESSTKQYWDWQILNECVSK